MLLVVIVMVIGRCLWRLCFFGSAVKVETELRKEMFNHCKDLSQNFYQKNKDVALLQSILNHSTPSVTLRYIGINQDMIDSNLKSFFL